VHLWKPVPGGEGYVGSVVALMGIMLGLEISSHAWN
jgi:hypothetical protein